MKRVTVTIEDNDGSITTITTSGPIEADKLLIDHVPVQEFIDLSALRAPLRPRSFQFSLSFVAHPNAAGECLRAEATSPDNAGSPNPPEKVE